MRNGRRARASERARFAAANATARLVAVEERRQRLDVAYHMAQPAGAPAFRLVLRLVEAQAKTGESDWKLFDPKSPVPQFEQIAQRFRIAISIGELRRGEHLPSMFALQDLLGVSRNTVRSAYLLLSREGLIRLGGAGGRPAFVIDVPDRRLARVRQQEARSVILHALMKCRRLGLSPAEMREAMDRMIL